MKVRVIESCEISTNIREPLYEAAMQGVNESDGRPERGSFGEAALPTRREPPVGGGRAVWPKPPFLVSRANLPTRIIHTHAAHAALQTSRGRY